MKLRIKRVVVNPHSLLHMMFHDTCWRVTNGIPKGAVLKGMTTDPFTQNIILFIEHSSFEEVDVKTIAPLLEVEFRKVQ